MIDRFHERTKWIEQNIMPHELQIRAWLSRNRVQNLDVDDIIQEMYARIASQTNLEEIRIPIRYAMQVAYSILVSHVRRMKSVTITSRADLDELGLPSLEASPEDELAQRDELREVEEALATLPERTRAILLLRRVDGLSLRETAERLAISEKTIQKHMTRATLFLMHRFGRGAKSAHQASLILADATDENDETSC
ncbi:MAG: sigma-70 family RNA polymerase sigma factor [Rhizomicrobium sp.]|nr:sigma-70 family RNA polymerase sigma factor [Rhizomicrobium sp.]